MSECIVPFAARQVQALTAAMERHGFIALCGPTGSGKHTLLQQAFRSTSVLRLECQMNGTNARAVVNGMQPTLTTDGGAQAVVWAVGPAELITESAVATLRTAAKRDGQRVVLVSCEKVHGLAKSEVIYYAGLDYGDRLKLAASLGLTGGRAHAAVKACGVDLRQLELAARFRTDGSDPAAHVWMDTRAILSGAQHKPVDYYNIDWLERNILDKLTPLQLDSAASFYENLALVDSMGADTVFEDAGKHIIKYSINTGMITKHRTAVQPPVRRPELQHNPRKWQKEMHAIHGNGVEQGAAASSGGSGGNSQQHGTPYSQAQKARRKALLRDRAGDVAATVAGTLRASNRATATAVSAAAAATAADIPVPPDDAETELTASATTVAAEPTRDSDLAGARLSYQSSRTRRGLPGPGYPQKPPHKHHNQATT